MNTPAPRTDEFERADCCDLNHALDFARSLERELASTTRLLADTSNELIRAHAEIRKLKVELEARPSDYDGIGEL